MSYTFTFSDQTVDPIGKAPISVPVGTVVSDELPIKLTGKGSANHGLIQQENLIHLLENFASATEPENPTVGQTWYDSTNLTLKVLTDTSPRTWKSLGGIQITEAGQEPAQAANGDVWYERSGTGSGFLYVYTGLGRYPTTATTIGGWEQIYPTVEVAGGRDEYDSLRNLLEQIAGSSVSAFGSGAIGRLITNLTDFGALDFDLRKKYDVIATTDGFDPTVLVSGADDVEITQQAISTTAFVYADSSSTNDSHIAGALVTQPGTIYLRGAAHELPIGLLNTDQKYDDAYIMYDTAASLQGGANYYIVWQGDDGSWTYDFGQATGVGPFTPTENMFIIGTYSSFQADTIQNNIYPGTKAGLIWAHAVPMVGAKTTHLKVEPNSQDWDALLAAAKYALNRLELPKGFVKTISPVPFVIDGRQAPSSLTDLPATDVRYPSAARRSRRRVGSVTQIQNFTETVNALNAGIANRFSLKGINGATGTNAAFDTTTVVSPWFESSNTVPTGVGSLRFALRFNDQNHLTRFLAGGSAVEITLKHEAGVTSADGNFRTLLNNASTFRVSADKTRTFGPSQPLTMSRATSNLGMWNANTQGVVLTSVTVGSVTLSITAIRVDETTLALEVAFNAGGTLGGTTTATVKMISSTEQFSPGSQTLYPTPIAYTPADILDPL